MPLQIAAFLKCEKNLTTEDIERADGKSSSVWIIHSKKTRSIKTFKNKNYSKKTKVQRIILTFDNND